MPRTKGSKNGISRTKGYTAVGKKAKGRWVNGRYVYDLPKFSSGGTEMIRDGKVVYENTQVPPGVASYPKKKTDWAKEAASYDNHVTTYPHQGYDALMMEKRNKWLSDKAKEQGAKNNWQQQAIKNAAKGNLSNRVLNGETKAAKANNGTIYTAKELGYQGTVTKSNTPGINTATDPRFNPIGSVKIDHAKGVAWDKKHLRELQAEVAKERAKEIHDSNIAGQNMAYENSKKAANRKAAEKSKAQGAQNNWQQRANETASNRMLYGKWREGAINATTSRSYMTPKGDYNPWVADAAKGSSRYMKRKEAAEKSKAQGAKNDWQQQAALEQWKKQSQNSIAEKKAIQKKKDLIAKADASYAKNLASEKGAKNNWQSQGNKEAARSQYVNMIVDDHAAIKKNSVKKMASPQKNAMRNDPRYSTGIGGVTFMTASQRDKYDYSGKRDDRAPTSHAFGKKPEKMDRTPYWDHMANSTNKQELAKAQAKSKEFMNDFRKSKIRNSRSDIGNALADAKEDAKKAWKKLFSKKKKKK